MKAFTAQLKAELQMTLTRGESLLLTLGIPVVVLVFFSLVPLMDTAGETAVDFLAPSSLALAVISMAMTGTAIATAFERDYGVLKRLGTTPLGRPRLLGAKIASIICVQIVQVFVLSVVALLLGWSPMRNGVTAWLTASAAMLLGTVAFAGLGLLMAGRLKATVTLAVANGLYILLLLVSGIIAPLSRFPDALQSFVRLLPSTALAQLIRTSFGQSGSTGGAWVVLAMWALTSVAAAVRWFRWE
jgi:ABC-2 type transport system permease protein